MLHTSLHFYCLPFFQKVEVLLPYGGGAGIQPNVLEGELVGLTQDCSADTECATGIEQHEAAAYAPIPCTQYMDQ